MNEITMFYYSDNGRWYKTWAENHSGDIGVVVKTIRVPANQIDSGQLRTESQASLTPVELLNEAKKLYQ